MKTTTLTAAFLLSHSLCLAQSDTAPQPQRPADLEPQIAGVAESRKPDDADRAAAAAGDVGLELTRDQAGRRLAATVRLAPDDADRMVVILVSDTDRARSAPGPKVIVDILDTDRWLLADDAADRQHRAEVMLPRADTARLDLRVFLQAVVVRDDGTFRVSPIMPLDLDSDAHGSAGGRPFPIDDQDVAPGDGGAIGDVPGSGSLSYDGPRLEARQLDAKGIFIEVEAPSNDYALHHEFNRDSGEGTDVFLLLEEPGEGEGLLDIVEYHSLAIGTSRRNGDRVRVFVAREKRHSPASDTRHYELAAEFMMR